jgi:hypothetical protein
MTGDEWHRILNMENGDHYDVSGERRRYDVSGELRPHYDLTGEWRPHYDVCGEWRPLRSKWRMAATI